MPRESDLPPSIAKLAYRHGVDIRSDQHFGGDVDQLIARLALALGATPAAPAVSPPAPRYPLPEVPVRLASLGFRGMNVNGMPAIVPPLITIPAGAFLRGSDKSKDRQAGDNEYQRLLEVITFQMAKYPVTVAEYALAVGAPGGLREPPQSKWNDVTWTVQRQHLDHPVVNVSWHDANAYISWLSSATGEQGWRLPSEAEWEKTARWDAARQVSRIYPWGDTFDKDRCNTRESGIGTTSPVGSYPADDMRRSGASPYGWRRWPATSGSG